MLGWFDVISLVAVALAPGSARADFDSGFAAFLDGEYAVAYTEWRPAAEGGHVEAQFGLAMLYYKGQGVARDQTQAAHWFGLAAEQGSMRARTQIGGMYARGEGVEADWTKAIAWWHMAAAQGSERAQYQLGLVYEHGTGVLRDLDAAERWYGEAAAQGYELAQHQLAMLRGDVVEVADDADDTDSDAQLALELSTTSVIYESSGDLDVTRPAGGSPLIPISGSQFAGFDQTHRIYLASYRGIYDAEVSWRLLVTENKDLLGPLSAALFQVDFGREKGVFYRLQAGPVVDGGSADTLCLKLVARGVTCVARRPN
ncbi:MAG: tetratricopeptide repeat protein [Alphaproteobacteria bacterium]